MTATIVPLSQLNKNDIPTAGGKGANLGEMTAAGFPVPAGFVLITEAYTTFVGAHGLQQRIDDLLAGLPADDPRAVEDVSDKIRQLFLDAEIADDIAAELFAAYEEMGEGPVAVRSSATAEDLPGASFAGQQETFLYVQGREALAEAVKACWAGLWTARALAYRARLGIDPDAVAMAVVVQVMVPAATSTEVTSGVLFTANPTSGARDELLVNASLGLGEAIVSGQVTPDTTLIDRQNLAVKETAIGTKEVMIVAAEQGTITEPVPTALQEQPALSAEQLGELAALGIAVEEHFGGVPQDIEWALADGKSWLLQARPITHLPPPPLRDVRWEPLRPGSIWMRRQVVEHMSEPLSPLFDELYLQEGLDRGMDGIADYMSDLSGFEINVWEFMQPPFAATINGYAYSVASFEVNWKFMFLALRMYTTVLPKMIRHLIPLWREKSLPEYQAAIAYWKDIDLANTSDEALLRGIRELTLEDAFYWFAAAVPLGMARTMDAVLDRYLKWVADGQGSSNGVRPGSASFLRGFPSKSVEAQAQLESIARKIDSSETLKELVATAPASRLLPLLAGHPEGQPVLDDLQAYLDAYGHQIYDLDFVVPTLAEDPLPVLLGLKTAVQHPDRDIRAQQAEMVQSREALVADMEGSLDAPRRWIFQRLLGWSQRYAPNREEALFYVGAAWPALRRLALELGRRLAEAGSLEEPADVFYLYSNELAAATSARAEGSGLVEMAELARERRVLREARKRLNPPVVVPPDGRLKFGPIDMAMFEPKSRALSGGPVLEGFAVSPGRVTAPASVIRSADEFDRMAPDTILVCTTTTPAWTPLFAQAKGLVTDIGGALAHGSIVAREYGIPAVMGTGEATQRIKSGQMIEVDGDAGTVTLIDEVEAVVPGQVEEEKTGVSAKKFAWAALAVGVVAGLLLWWKKRR